MKKNISLIILFGWIAGMQSSYGQVTLPGTKVEYLESENVDQKFELQINLPSGYEENSEKFGVVYVLDAQWDFPLVYALYGEQYYDGFIPPLILVGITWDGDTNYRSRDFTPTPQNGNGGEASKFLRFIMEELSPYIESNYKADPNSRTIMGSSLGGLFTMYAALESDGFFHNFIPTSPAYGWDNGALIRLEEEFHESGKSLNGRMYSAIGGVEGNVKGYEEFMKKIQSRNYEGFELEYKILQNIGHSGSKAEGDTRGLQFVFERNSIELSKDQLKKITGKYSTENYTVELVGNNGKPILKYPNGYEVALTAESETSFYLPDAFLNLKITKEGFVLERFGSSEEFVKK